MSPPGLSPTNAFDSLARPQSRTSTRTSIGDFFPSSPRISLHQWAERTATDSLPATPTTEVSSMFGPGFISHGSNGGGGVAVAWSSPMRGGSERGRPRSGASPAVSAPGTRLRRGKSTSFHGGLDSVPQNVVHDTTSSPTTSLGPAGVAIGGGAVLQDSPLRITTMIPPEVPEDPGSDSHPSTPRSNRTTPHGTPRSESPTTALGHGRLTPLHHQHHSRETSGGADAAGSNGSGSNGASPAASYAAHYMAAYATSIQTASKEGTPMLAPSSGRPRCGSSPLDMPGLTLDMAALAMDRSRNASTNSTGGAVAFGATPPDSLLLGTAPVAGSANGHGAHGRGHGNGNGTDHSTPARAALALAQSTSRDNDPKDKSDKEHRSGWLRDKHRPGGKEKESKGERTHEKGKESFTAALVGTFIGRRGSHRRGVDH